MRFENLVGRNFGDLKEVEKTAVLSSLNYDNTMWNVGRLNNGRYEVTADITGTNVAIPAVFTVGTDEDIIKIDDNSVFYDCVQGVQ